MRRYIELDQTDIQTIIANHFKTTLSNVDIDIFEDVEGYGEMEHTVMKIKATIEEEEDNGLPFSC